jgi:hypothetical protein
MWRRITNSDMLFRFVTADPMRAAGLILPDERANVNKPAERRHSTWLTGETPRRMGKIPQY